MRKRDLQSFKKILLERREKLSDITKHPVNGELAIDTNELPDEVDLASSEGSRSFDCRLRDRNIRLLQKIDDALKRIEEGNFGICDECGESIRIARLKARPVATLCIDCKERQERMEKSQSTPPDDQFSAIFPKASQDNISE